MTPSEFKPDVWYRLPTEPWQVCWDSKLKDWMFRCNQTGVVPIPKVMTFKNVTRNDWEPVEPEPLACPDYGEPWRNDRGDALTRDGHSLSWDEFVERSIPCVNALAGIADPVEWVERAKRAMSEATK